MNWEVLVDAAEASNEVILEGANGAFGGVTTMDVRRGVALNCCSAHVTKVTESVLWDEQPTTKQAHQVASILTELQVGEPGCDPTPFLQLPITIRDINKLPANMAHTWIKALTKVSYRHTCTSTSMCHGSPGTR